MQTNSFIFPVDENNWRGQVARFFGSAMKERERAERKGDRHVRRNSPAKYREGRERESRPQK